MNVHAPNEKKGDDSKDSFREEIEQVIDNFPKYHIKILSGDLMQKWYKSIFVNRQLGIRVYIRRVLIMVSE